MLRVFGVLVTVLCAIAVAVLTWPQFFRLERTWPLAQFVAFRGVVTLSLAALLILLLLLMLVRPLRGFAASLALIALVAGLVNGAVVFSRGIDTGTLPPKGPDSIRVLTWNTAGEATRPADIARTAVAMEVDVVMLPETTLDTGTEVAVQMRRLGHPMWAHHDQFGEHGWDASSTSLLISPRLGDYAVIESTADGASNTSAVPSVVAMPVDRSGPTIVAAHAVAPRREAMSGWRHDLQWLANQCASDDVIMAGDFNATVDHMSRLGVDGATLGRCRDAGAATGIGGVGTWPTSLPPLLGTPIDHVMATDAWKPAGAAVLTAMDGTGSDHRPLVVQFDPAT